MRKIALIILIAVMNTAPCLGQIESQGLFSIENTLWSTLSPKEDIAYDDDHMGFADGKVYSCQPYDPEGNNPLFKNCIWFENQFASYVDSPMISTFSINYPKTIYYGSLQPLFGIGIRYYAMGYGGMEDDYISRKLLFKVRNNWKPPSNQMCGGPEDIQCPEDMQAQRLIF